ncbi:MAG TPA: TIM barrel protein [Phycisphaerae bacterium]|jgi:hydroxypyruvate isomerase
MPLDSLASSAAAMGFVGIDLVDPPEWPTLRRHGLICTMTPTHTIVKGLNNPANHAECLAKIRASVEATAAAGFPNVICFSGNREAGISDYDGLRHCVAAIRQVIGQVETAGVTLCMELLNSKVDHPGYMCDRSDWGAALVAAVGSPRFKLLYDIYHMQVQEGDVIATIKKHHAAIGHYHTAGVPGRNELGDSQELNYPAIMRAIADTHFTGIVAQEFIPKGDAMDSLGQAAACCDV